ncbi:unnamed protein product [Arctia plantaginis]|uniref:Uncharacterized protein n=1 Tax=Arctia plantaginis TaxID=874455 RepID=A0A8S0ZXT4_ARCPL|nr:unnamed protein product [Arctia plantaginis]
MKFVHLLVGLSCMLWEIRGYPYYPTYGNIDTYSYGDSSRGGMALSRYYNPYYNPGNGGASMAAFLYRQPEQATLQESSQYYLPDRRRQIPQEANFNVPPQQNEIFYAQQPENPAFIPTEATELVEPTEKAVQVAPTTSKSVIVPELVEHEIEEVPEEEPVPKPKKAVTKRKQVKRPIDDDDEDDAYSPKMPAAAYFPMFFGWGGRSGGQPNGGGPTAIANAFSTGRGGVATSHATAYGMPRPQERV